MDSEHLAGMSISQLVVCLSGQKFHKDGLLDFAYALMDRANVVVTPGHAFGPHGEGFVRIALVQDKEVLQQVVENIRNSGIFVLEKVNELEIIRLPCLTLAGVLLIGGTFICILKTHFPIVIHF